MLLCMFCDKPVPDTEKDAIHHDVCDAEYNRRYDANICVRCGVNDQTHTGLNYTNCDDCWSEAPYKGYPPA